MKEKFIGSWELLWATQYRDDVKSFHHGEKPLGQIIYSADGRMSATIMNPIWMNNPERRIRESGEFMAYAGPWEIVGDTVRHHVKIASWRELVGVTLERKFELRGENEVFLTTAPQTTKKGVTYRQELLWRRFGL